MSIVVNVINLPHRQDRMMSAIAQSVEQGFDIRRWNGIIDKPPFKGISRAHKQIIQFAKENNIEEAIVMEDDCVFTAPGAFDFFIKNKPEDFDIYFGMIYSAQIEGNRIINGFSGMTFYIVNKRFYDFFLSAPDTDTDKIKADHIDRWLGNTAFKHKYIVCSEFVCYQIEGFSDNHKQKSNYQPYYVDKKWYVNPPPNQV